MTDQLNNWDLIVATLYWKGNANRMLDDGARRRVWAHADGYGKMSIVELQRLELLEDWSHIRDSSDEGQKQVAQAIRQELAEMDIRDRAEFARKFPGIDTSDLRSKREQTVAEIVAKLGARS